MNKTIALISLLAIIILVSGCIQIKPKPKIVTEVVYKNISVEIDKGNNWSVQCWNENCEEGNDGLFDTYAEIVRNSYVYENYTVPEECDNITSINITIKAGSLAVPAGTGYIYYLEQWYIALFNYNTSKWETIGKFTVQGRPITFKKELTDIDNYIRNGVLQIRSNPNHVPYLRISSLYWEGKVVFNCIHKEVIKKVIR